MTPVHDPMPVLKARSCVQKPFGHALLSREWSRGWWASTRWCVRRMEERVKAISEPSRLIKREIMSHELSGDCSAHKVNAAGD